MYRLHNHRSPITGPAHYRELYERNRLPVFRYIYGLTGGPQELVEDLVAETFLRGWKARRRFEGDMEAAAGWLIRIAKRLVIDDYRRKQRDTRNHSAFLPVDACPEQTALDGEQQRFLLALLADLPAEQCEVITLRHLLGWGVREIALHTGKTENNISVMIHRALSALRDKWAQLDPDEIPAKPRHKEK